MVTERKKIRLKDISIRTDEPLITVTANDLMPLPPPLDQPEKKAPYSPLSENQKKSYRMLPRWRFSPYSSQTEEQRGRGETGRAFPQRSPKIALSERQLALLAALDSVPRKLCSMPDLQ